MDPQSRARHQIAAWATPERKTQFSALAASRGLSESKLLGLLIDSVLVRNPVDRAVEERYGQSRDSDRISVRLRPGDGKLLRLRARGREMNYTTYAAALIRAHVRANPPMPVEELARLERSLAEISAISRSLRQIAKGARQGQGIDPAFRLDLAAFLETVEQLRQELHDVVRANVISWEARNAEAAG